MFSDPEARGGILEPAGIVEIKFRLADQLKAMHRIDPQLQALDAELEGTEDTDARPRGYQGADCRKRGALETCLPPGGDGICRPP